MRVFLHSGLASTTLSELTAEGRNGGAGSVPCLLETRLWGQAVMVPDQKTACSLKSERESHQQLKTFTYVLVGGSVLLRAQFPSGPAAMRERWGINWVCNGESTQT